MRNFGSKLGTLGTTAWTGTKAAAGTTAGKIALTFLTLLGVWGFGSYEIPKFFKWLSSEAPFIKYVIQWLMMFVLAYQGLGDKDLVVSLVSSLLFFGIFEIVKLIERQVWPDEPEPVPEPPTPTPEPPAPEPPAPESPAPEPPAPEPFFPYY